MKPEDRLTIAAALGAILFVCMLFALLLRHCKMPVKLKNAEKCQKRLKCL